MGGTALGQGRGEDLRQLPSLPPLDIVVAHPGVCLSTTEAYAALRPEQMGDGEATQAMVAAIQRRDLHAVVAGLFNVFEENALRRVPAISRIKTLMIENGAWNACLSGSGSSVFALAGSPTEAETIAAVVRREFPTVFVTRTRAR